MKTMMKILCLVMALVMLAGCLAACGEDAPKATDPETTTTPSTPTNPDPTEPDPTNPPDDGKKEYKVNVVDSNGNPVVGVMVQICHTGNCFGPYTTDSDGSCTTRLIPGDDYYGTITKDQSVKVYFESGFEVTLVYNPPVAE